MDNEINLKEILQLFWRGKYFILAVTAIFAIAAFFYVFIMVTPAYRFSAFLDLTPYQVDGKDAIMLIEQKEVVLKSVKDLVGNLEPLVQSIEIKASPDNKYVLKIGVEYTDPEVCVNSVKQTGLGIIETVSEYCREDMSFEEEHNRRLISYLDEMTAEYLLTRDEKILELLEEDPIYRRILEEKAEYLVQLELLNFNLGELSQIKKSMDDHWVDSLATKAQPVSGNKKTYIAIALLFGFMLSLFLLYLRHYFSRQAGQSAEVQ